MPGNHDGNSIRLLSALEGGNRLAQSACLTAFRCIDDDQRHGLSACAPQALELSSCASSGEANVQGYDLGCQRTRVLEGPGRVRVELRYWHYGQVAAHGLKRIRTERPRRSA